MAVWLIDNGVARIREVTVRRAQLKPNSITLAGSKLVADRFKAGSKLVADLQ